MYIYYKDNKNIPKVFYILPNFIYLAGLGHFGILEFNIRNMIWMLSWYSKANSFRRL